MNSEISPLVWQSWCACGQRATTNSTETLQYSTIRSHYKNSHYNAQPMASIRNDNFKQDTLGNFIARRYCYYP